MNLKPRPAMPSEMGNAPIRLEQDDKGRWVIMLNDGAGHVMEAILPEDVVDQIAARIAQEPASTAMPGLQAQVTVVEYANLGDSAAFIRKPLAYDPTETVEALLIRAHGLGSQYRHHAAGERVELQVIQETIPKPDPSASDPWRP